MNTQYIIEGIGNSMKHWANYINDVKRGKIINESAIKYGISEFLVASENLRNDTGSPQIRDVCFENRHDVFKKRRIDLSFKIEVNNNDIIEIFFEFKYLKDLSLDASERERYIDDLFRLASLAKWNNKGRKYECYFMLVGNPIKVANNLKTNRHINNLKTNRRTNNREQIKPIQKHSDIDNCFSLRKNGTKKVLLGKLRDDKKESHLKRFNQKYRYRDEIDKEYFLEDSDCMKTILKYTTRPTDEEVGVYIWQVKI